MFIFAVSMSPFKNNVIITRALPGGESASEIFRYARMSIASDNRYTRYEMLHAGLHLFARHSGQLSQFLLDDYQVAGFSQLYMTMKHVLQLYVLPIYCLQG